MKSFLMRTGFHVGRNSDDYLVLSVIVLDLSW